ncbi:MAG: lysylphosphatidylglycerol synthase domain-containing protein [Lutibacter sp.]|uniref:lysylphosphatidylglycerol synthase domain-containing protein n=1 Tax=Lutibacter sp. TaxID=1925666 RepID=UPI00385BF1E5
MYNISHKYKRILFLLIKLVIVSGALYFIYEKLVHNQLLSFSEFQGQLAILFSTKGWLLLLLLFFTDANWLLEIYKWKILASLEKKLTFFEAYQQTLASLTASIITPNRIGEYGVKALYFKQSSRKKIVLLNFIGNISQLLVTLIFGFIGVVFLFTNFKAELPLFNLTKFLLICILISVLIIFRNRFGFAKIASNYFNKSISFLKTIAVITYSKILFISFARYLVFSHQFYFLLKLFEIETDYFTLMQLLFCVYFIASIIPSLTIFDWAIKGSVAVYFFSLIHLNELTIITVTTIMWILNFALPTLLGSIFILNFKFSNNT